MFSTVLVANRGEIAVRVIRTLRQLGIRSVAVFSDADADARHVREADTAVRIGPAAAAESYLSVERLLDAARRTGAEAVHPGYGFLAENAGFAAACEEAGLAFIGPPASAISLMGDKIRAKETVKAAGVPVVPGSSGSGLSDAELVSAAEKIGMPVLLKPSAGGGGKGMRLVRDADLLGEEIAAARREARSSFGDDTLLVERWVDRPRHIEIQVLADAHGNVVHLGERECSLQRRHQKVIEEAPSVLLTPQLRASMGAAAVEAARSCGYVGAGTVEFIVPGGDPSSYYFMEMNTRLQVEHPVTELITGLDLVEQQLRVAAGEPLGFGQADVTLTGHAIEARVCAEDPARGFLPSGGTVLALSEPSGGAVRTDSGLLAGVDTGSTYDPMLSKVIVHGPDRATALRMLRGALADTVILGVQTNAGFLRRLLAHPDVVSGDLDTGLVERDLASLLPDSVPSEVYAAAALLDVPRPAPSRNPAGGPGDPGWVDPFGAADGWRLGGTPAWTVRHFRLPGQDPVEVRTRQRGTEQEILLAGQDAAAADGAAPDAAPAASGARSPGQGPGTPARGRVISRDHDRLTIELDGVTHRFSHTASAEGVWLGRDGDSWHVQAYDPVTAKGAAAAGADALAAPMPGTVTVVKVAVGDHVTAGQSLLVVEAMKMEHVISAPHSGTVTELDVSPGTTVAMDQVLAVVTPDEEEKEETS
ncbi:MULTISPECIES: acetyl/propionyl/methylcrotonyl-CoA carboxylase subunit alpha [unclassified Streptomyces]|uniref:acetyl/propionyl/methylcrotonyl-CoA carboxylase subunit alpha n=1 Tax=unclassified Streptomyces TaxID=2593676 RepID=UPI002E3306F7|nr:MULTISPECIES: acetyl/propionyl/methylcrotonyl-CoA carboxylase subunit alpha [unclassified Streptomyces]WUC66371.1 acetyl/propionyl/methylcrotonyl-CoA carboxylase subunit alpha [Streptomyces sp. NBC_00539]